MTVLALSEIKHHLRLDQADESQDSHLELLLGAAKGYAEQYLGRPVPWSENCTEVPLPDPIKAAMLLLIGDLYENREETIAGTIVAKTGAVDRLLHFYRVGLGI